jgi:Gametolysin peptidase M11
MYLRPIGVFFLFLLLGETIVCVNAAPPTIVTNGAIRHVIIEGAETRSAYLLEADGGKSYPIDNADALLGYANRRVSVKGTIKDGLLSIEGPITILSTPEVTIPPPTFGARKILFILANFTNDQSQTMTHAQVRAGLFEDPDSVDKLFRAASSGRYGLTGIQNPNGDVVGWVTIPFTNQNCESLMFGQWSDAADNAARAAGFEPNNYNSVLYVFPPTPACSLTYLGTLGDPGSQATQRSWYQAKTMGFPFLSKAIAHEIGHNMGLHHSSAYRCSGPNIPADCQSTEYGDPACLMSAANDLSLQFPNNYHMLRLGWLEPGKMRRLDTPGSYTVTLHSPASWSKGIKGVQIPLKDANGQLTGKSYFLEARRNMPFDVMWSGIRRFASGVGIRYAPDDLADRASRTYLIDTTPATPIFDDAPLAIGQTYSDTVRGITITTLRSNPVWGTRVRIELTR